MIIKKRKERKDKIYKTRRKGGKMLPYYSKRNKNDPIKIWWWEQVPMGADSIKRIPVGLRSTARKIKFIPRMRVDVPAECLKDEKSIENLAVQTIGSSGSYYLMMFCHSKNKHHVSPKKACSVSLFETDNGLKAKFGKNFRLHRYWFFRKALK